MTANLYIDVHVLQDVPPANLNRDDTGSPKSARYGGVDRLRVSSQAWKRATRLDFGRHMPKSALGQRTRRVRESIIHSLTDGGVPAEVAEAYTAKALVELKLKANAKKEEENSYLLFFSLPQLAEMTAQVKAREDLWGSIDDLYSAVNLKEILGRGHSLDVALFGRMVADLPDLNVDAACQVSHALGTHAAPTQFDYFTAVDDAQTGAETGAGMIGSVEFNSATLYRYATVNFPELASNLGGEGDPVAGLQQFLRSFTLSLPTGKQNTFAAHTRPGLVWFVVRGDRPVNYMSAFEKPVVAGREGYLASSIERLASFVADEKTRWGDTPLASAATYVAGIDGATAAFGDPVPFDAALAVVTEAVGHGVDQ